MKCYRFGLVTAILAMVLSARGVESIGGKEPPRAARSVHLGWTAPTSDCFYLETVVEHSTTGSYFMACGWNTGYFGIQELGNGHKVALFSVWDPTRGDDPKAVNTEDRVEVLHQGSGVRIKRFGGEGTGGQCMMDFDWRIGQTNRFLVRSIVQSNKTAYAGFLYLPANKEWKHLVTFRTRSGGRPLQGLYSFVEDFRRDGKSVQDLREARFGCGWVKTVEGQWKPLKQAQFTASGAAWEAKENINAGLTGQWFFLATGGETVQKLDLRSTISIEGTEADPPGDLPVAPAGPSVPKSNQ
jgi:hypothetical protein